MSIYRCTNCEDTFDGDYVGCFEYEDKEVCQECYNGLTQMFGRDDEDHTDKPDLPAWDMKGRDFF